MNPRKIKNDDDGRIELSEFNATTDREPDRVRFLPEEFDAVSKFRHSKISQDRGV